MLNLSTTRCIPEDLGISILIAYQDSGTLSPQSISNLIMRLLSVTYETTYGITLSGTLTHAEAAHSIMYVHVSVVANSSTHLPFNL